MQAIACCDRRLTLQRRPALCRFARRRHRLPSDDIGDLICDLQGQDPDMMKDTDAPPAAVFLGDGAGAQLDLANQAVRSTIRMMVPPFCLPVDILRDRGLRGKKRTRNANLPDPAAADYSSSEKAVFVLGCSLPGERDFCRVGYLQIDDPPLPSELGRGLLQSVLVRQEVAATRIAAQVLYPGRFMAPPGCYHHPILPRLRPFIRRGRVVVRLRGTRKLAVWHKSHALFSPLPLLIGRTAPQIGAQLPVLEVGRVQNYQCRSGNPKARAFPVRLK